MTEFGPPQRTSYHVRGASLQDVSDAMSHLPEAGKASWTLTYANSQDDSGSVTEAVVRCGFEVQMPVWDDYRSVSQAAKDEWDRWWVALDTHEQGHVEIATRGFDGLEREMVGKTVSEADAAFRAAEARVQAESDAFDVSTEHGVRTGTMMDTSIV